MKSWAFIYRIKGDKSYKKHRFTLGQYPAVSLADARDRAREVIQKASRGQDPQAGIVEGAIDQPEGVTVEDLAKLYIRDHSKPLKKSWTNDVIYLRNVTPVIGNRPAKSITRTDVREILKTVEDRGRLGVSANRTLATMRAMWNWGIDEGLVETNPCARLKCRSFGVTTWRSAFEP